MFLWICSNLVGQTFARRFPSRSSRRRRLRRSTRTDRPPQPPPRSLPPTLCTHRDSGDNTTHKMGRPLRGAWDERIHQQAEGATCDTRITVVERRTDLSPLCCRCMPTVARRPSTAGCWLLLGVHRLLLLVVMGPSRCSSAQGRDPHSHLPRAQQAPQGSRQAARQRFWRAQWIRQGSRQGDHPRPWQRCSSGARPVPPSVQVSRIRDHSLTGSLTCSGRRLIPTEGAPPAARPIAHSHQHSRSPTRSTRSDSHPQSAREHGCRIRCGAAAAAVAIRAALGARWASCGLPAAGTILLVRSNSYPPFGC